MQLFKIHPAIFERFPDLKLGVLVLNGAANGSSHPDLDALLLQAQESARQNLKGAVISEHPHVAPWREAYRAFGVKAKKYPSSIENLLKRVGKGETLRSINPLVDLYNIVSLKHLMPVGGEDIDSLHGDVELRFAGESEPAVRLLGDSEEKSPKAGEVIYTDEVGAICRRFNWKEADRSKLTPDTKHAVLVVEALPPVSSDALQTALDEITELAERFCQARVTQHILDKDSLSVPLNENGA